MDDSHVYWSCLVLGEGQRDADVGIKRTGSGATGWAEDGGTKLSLKEVLDETIIAPEVGDQGFCGNLLVRSTNAVL